MKQTYLPYLLLFCALGLSSTAAYYSVIGLSVIFSSVAIPVIVMGTFLEISKLAIATYLHNAWSKIYTMLKVYLVTAVVVLSFITSLGIYGLLSGGFQQNISKLEVNARVVENISSKKLRRAKCYPSFRFTYKISVKWEGHGDKGWVGVSYFF